MPALPGASSGLPVQFVITSPGDYRTLYQVAQDVQKAASEKGLFIFSQLDMSYGAALVDVTINRNKAGAYGVSMKDIADTLAIQMGDGSVNRISINGRGYEVIPQVVRADRLTPEAIGRFHVISQNGTPVPLRNLVDFKVEGQPRSLNQLNQVNAVTLGAVLMPGGSMGEAIAYLRDQVGASLPEGYAFEFLGESRQFVQEGSSLYMTFLLALFIVFLVLAAQFESLRDPLVILVSVPMAVCGALLLLGFGLATLNIYTQIGLITLIGLITKHGILMCEVAKEQQIQAGLNRIEAIRYAARIRLRAILMTTAATVAGLVPLLLSQGAGANSRFGIGLVIVAGLSIGTLFTLFVLPVVYSYIASKHKPLPIFDENAPAPQRLRVDESPAS